MLLGRLGGVFLVRDGVLDRNDAVVEVVGGERAAEGQEEQADGNEDHKDQLARSHGRD